MNLLRSSASSLSTSNSTGTAEENKSRLRIGLDWFQSQLPSADGILPSTFQIRRRQKRHNPYLEKKDSESNHRIQIDTDRNIVYDTIGLEDYTDVEYRNTFYDGEDLKYIFERTHKVVLKMESGEIDPNFCTRGLDKLYGERQEMCRSIRSKAINAVMDLQEEQWQNGVDDFDALAAVYREITNEAAKRAFHEAKQDVRAAQNHLQDVDTSQWDKATLLTTTKWTKPILKQLQSLSPDIMPKTQSLFPESQSTRRERGIASCHDQRMPSLRANCKSMRSSSIPSIQRDPRALRDVLSSSDTPMQRAKERLTHPTVNNSQIRRHTIVTALENASKVVQDTEKVKHPPLRCMSAHAGPKSSRSGLSDSSHSQASFASDDHKALPSRRILRSNSAAVTGAKLSNSSHHRKSASTGKQDGDDSQHSTTRDVDQKRVLPRRSSSAAVTKTSTSINPLHTQKTSPVRNATASADVQKRAPPQRSKSDLMVGVKKSSSFSQQRRTSLNQSKDDDSQLTNESVKNRMPPNKSQSGPVIGAKIRRLSRSSTSEDEDAVSQTQSDNQEKNSIQKRAPPQKSKSGLIAGARISRFSRSSVPDNSENLSVSKSSTNEASVKKKKHPQRSLSDLHLRTGRSDNGDVLSVSQSSTKETSVKKKVLPRRSASDHHLRTGRPENDEILSVSESSTNEKSVKKKTLPRRSMSDLRRQTTPSKDEDDVVSGTASCTNEALAKKKARPQRSLSDHHLKKCTSQDSDDDDILSLDDSSNEGRVVKKRSPPQRSSSSMLNGNGKPSSTRVPPRERPK